MIQTLSPNGGELFAPGETVRVHWLASDADGDPLVYSVAISPDNGQKWMPLVIDLSQSSFDFQVPQEMYAGSLLLRVAATDGVNTNARIAAAPLSITEFSPVSIDVRPGSYPNTVLCTGHTEVPVALLSTALFDARTIDVSTVRFGRSGTESAEVHKDRTGRPKLHFEDANGDGRVDAVFHFAWQDTGLRCGDTIATLKGRAFAGQAVRGTDSVQTVDRRKLITVLFEWLLLLVRRALQVLLGSS